MPTRTPNVLIALLLSASTLAPTAVRADHAALMRVQDPPVIPRALIKRPAHSPQRFVRTELFFGTVAPGAVVSEERFLAFLDTVVTPRFRTA